jgi:hypothetical protein
MPPKQISRKFLLLQLLFEIIAPLATLKPMTKYFASVEISREDYLAKNQPKASEVHRRR